MRVFITGASGFIGSAVLQELVRAGHQVVGLARSEASAAALTAAGAQVQRGDLEDLDALRAGAASADGVIHLAFIHDFSNFAASARTDERAVQALGTAIEGSGKPLVVASGVIALAPGRVATERDEATGSFPRTAGMRMTMSFNERGVRASLVRFAPTVHGRGDHGFVPALIAIARAKGVAGYIDDGSSRWPAVHRFDAASCVRLAVEKGPTGAVHAIAEEGIPTRTIAEAIGRHLKVPVASIPAADAAAHFGFLGEFFGMDSPASSAVTRELLDWNPVHPGLIADLDEGHYFDANDGG
ncbi:MAG TPA: SDR family oxidoreductase [Polyangiaceae bacterium]|jgi:nucleoside-diphosphate-sugar epimerase|nr:SDR family oxidoreductase [Polyangiaceae bacterium]